MGESWWAVVSGGGPDMSGCGGKICADRQYGNVDFRREGWKRLGPGQRVAGGGVWAVRTRKGHV